MKKSKFSLKQHKDEFVEFVKKTDHKRLALWAINCAERVLPYFEEKFPEDHSPRMAIEALQAWMSTGVFKMAVIRKASLDSHAAAIYALQAIHRATNSSDADAAVAKEREWQYQHLLKLKER